MTTRTGSMLSIENHPGFSILHFFGTIEAATVEDMKPQIKDQMPETARSIVADLQNVDFLDSHGVGLFVSLLKKAHARGGRLVFVGACDQPASVLGMVGFNNDLVTYCDDLQRAQSVLRAP